MNKVHIPHLLHHETKRHALLKFILVLSVLLLYMIYVSLKFGAGAGAIVTALTWSFFVLCTPVADAGFLIDFPMRVILGIRMFLSESLVYSFAIFMNVYFAYFNPEIYSSTPILELFYKILTTPIPFWSIIALSAMGTFMSVYFGDELLDLVNHKERVKYKKHSKKYAAIAFLAVFVFIWIVYLDLVASLNINFLI